MSSLGCGCPFAVVVQPGVGPRLGRACPRWFTLVCWWVCPGKGGRESEISVFGYRIICRGFMEVSVFFQLSSVWARLFSVAVFVRVP